MPKGNNHTGKVVIFTSSLQNIVNISGEQMGSYFGYSLTTADVNGDGYDDLIQRQNYRYNRYYYIDINSLNRHDDIIIGAPFFSSPEEKDRSYEKGRIYVALQTRDVSCHFSLSCLLVCYIFVSCVWWCAASFQSKP